jgi:hypothetical protein
MASINIFCDPSELREWIVALCESKELGIIYFDNGVGKTAAPDAFVLSEYIYQIFLFPKCASIANNLTLNDVRQREWGWINIRPGGIKRLTTGSCLLFSEIHGEKSDLPTGNPHRWVQWLKAKIESNVHVGVVGTNVTTGGTSMYDDIWFTDKAEALLKSGALWKQFTTANSIFEPDHQHSR